MSIARSDESLLPQLSQLLGEGFGNSGNVDYSHLDALRWKFFEDRGHSFAPRSLIAQDGAEIKAHMGLCTTEFVSTTSQQRVPATHITDWIAFDPGGGWGGVLMMKAFEFTETQYAFGSTAIATRVLLKGGYEAVQHVPLYHKIFDRFKPAVWRMLHGKQPLPKQLALLTVDSVRSFRPARPDKDGAVRAIPVKTFGTDIQKVVQNCHFPLTFTSRSPALLNYYLKCPFHPISGWRLEDKGDLRGFALTTIIDGKGIRFARIVDCFLSSDSPSAWLSAIASLEQQLRQSGVSVISCYASAPWVEQSLQWRSFIRRGRTTFFLRDQQGKVPRKHPFHLTHLEADMAYI